MWLFSLWLAFFSTLALAQTDMDGRGLDSFDDSVPLGILEYPAHAGSPKSQYLFTFDDMVWAAAVLEGETDCTESEHSAAVLWALASRGALIPEAKLSNGPSSAHSFGAFLQRYSVTVNKRFIGSLPGCRDKRSKRVSYAGNCSRKTIAERERRLEKVHKILRKKTWAGSEQNTFKHACKALAYKFMTNQLKNPVPGAVEFSAECELGSGAARQFDYRFMDMFSDKDGKKAPHAQPGEGCPPPPARDRDGNPIYAGDLFYSGSIQMNGHTISSKDLAVKIYTQDHYATQEGDHQQISILENNSSADDAAEGRAD